MKVQLENTTKIVTLNGIQCRVWEGQTSSGIPVHAYIPRIAVKEGLDCTEFERELAEQKKPTAEVEAIPLRMIL